MNMTTSTELLAAATVSDPRWAAVLARDAAADGSFFYSVQTTGVYCRPSCAARPARPENVRLPRQRGRAPSAPAFAPASAAGPTSRRGPSSTPRWSPSCAASSSRPSRRRRSTSWPRAPA